MLSNITFCTSRTATGDDLTEMNQCMTFSFTERALKMFSPAFLRRISTDKKQSENESDGFEIGVNEDGSPQLARIRRLDENLWRIPTRQLDAFVRFLFKYLPAEVSLPGQAMPEPPECDCSAP